MRGICAAAKTELTQNIRVYKKLLNEAVASYNCILRGEVRYMVRVLQSALGCDRLPTIVWDDDLKTAIWQALEKSQATYPIDQELLRNKDILSWLEGRIMVLLVPTKGQEINMCEHSKIWLPYVASGVKRLLPKPKKRAKRKAK